MKRSGRRVRCETRMGDVDGYGGGGDGKGIRCDEMGLQKVMFV